MTRVLWNLIRPIGSPARRLLRRSKLRARDLVIGNLGLPLIYSPWLGRATVPKAVRSRPRFLIVRQKYARSGDAIWDSNEEHALSGPLKSANLAEISEYFCDIDGSGGIFNDKNFLQLVGQVEPDLIILGGYDPDHQDSPNIKVLEAVRNRKKTPILAMWPDSTAPESHRLAARMSKIVDLNVMWDSGLMADRFPEQKNYLRLWAPLDFSVFHPGDGDRDIPVSFMGSTDSYRSERRDYTNRLADADIGFIKLGGRENPLSLKEYAGIARRSKICLNFSHGFGDTHQLKHRVFETMFSGAMLLENKNDETSRFFRPMVEYVEFESMQDMVDKARYYLEHEEQRQEIALNGYRAATQKYNHTVFWSRITSKLAELNILPAPIIQTRGQ